MESQEFKKTCVNYRKSGLSLNEIVKRTGRSKTSIYFHIQNIPLNSKRRKEISLSASKRILEINAQKKGKSRLNRHPICFSLWTKELVCLISHLIFDGEIKHAGCIYTNRSAVLLQQVIDCMPIVYSYHYNKIESTPGVFRLSYFNVELSKYLKEKSVEMINKIRGMKTELQLSFLKAFFDDEGSVYFIGKRRSVRGYQHNIKILEIVKELLQNFGIEGKIDKKYYEIVISKKENLEKFAKEINFSPGLCVNGNRGNSVWKKSLEKREILKMALESYLS